MSIDLLKSTEVKVLGFQIVGAIKVKLDQQWWLKKYEDIFKYSTDKSFEL